LIVPGLFFWFTLSLFRPPPKLEVPLGDRLIYSVIISVVCLMIAGCLGYFFHGPWINYFDISASLSIPKLFALALAGSVPGAFIGLLCVGSRMLKRSKEQERLITPNDDLTILIEKILLLNPNYRGIPVSVRLKDNSEFVGAHWARTTDATFLVGSFEVKQEDLSADLNNQIRPHLKNAQINQEGSDILHVVKAIKASNSALITQSSPVEQLRNNERNETGKNYLRWANDEISGITRDSRKNLPLLKVS
jgi:hypothetical protein